MLSRIKADQVQARKNRDTIKASILTTLLGEATPTGNQATTDNDVIKVVNKFVKNIDESLKLKHNDVLVQERNILCEYLPPVLDVATITEIFESIDESDYTFSSFMSLCKKAALSQNKLFDGKLVKDTVAKLIEKD